MERTNLFAAAERFCDLYRRWDGAIPLDDLLPYLAWYRSLAPADRGAFRTRAMLLVVRAYRLPDQVEARPILDWFRRWFPPSAHR